MNISYNWLKDLVEFDLSPRELAQALTDVGLAVEGVHEVGADFVLDVDLTSNRSDCLSHLGTAREIAAVTSSKFHVPSSKSGSVGGDISSLTSVAVEDAELCPRYMGRIVRGVRIAPSPDWLRERLEAIGQRAINNVADITNFVMHELGQPLHAFDFDKLAQHKIVVRRARDGEKMTTLDGVEREFDANVLLICDAEKPVAIGGVMGGLDSGISDATTDVLIEAAFFRRDNIRQTARKLSLTTEASYRFERGTDIENVIRASNRCVELICEIAGGAATENAIDVYPVKPKEVVVPFRPSRVAALTGLEVAPEKMLHILEALGFRLQETDEIAGLHFVVPTWRHDIEREEDLVEEIARHTGYAHIAEELPPAFGAGAYQPNELRKKQARQALTALGFDEAVSYSFINIKHDDEFEFLPGLIDEFAAQKFVTLRDSIIEGAVRMRPTLLAGLLDATRENFNQNQRNVKLFEIGRVFAGFGGVGSLPTEREALALIVTGAETLANQAQTKRELDFYDVKGALDNALSAMNAPELEYEASEIKHLQAGQSAKILCRNDNVGFIGKLSNEIAANYKFKQAVFIAEIDLQKVLANAPTPILYQSLPQFPGIARDVSFVVKRLTAFGEMRQFVLQQQFELLKTVEFVGVYEGANIADDSRSLTLRFEYRADDRTLREDEVEIVHQQILRAVENKFAAVVRT